MPLADPSNEGEIDLLIDAKYFNKILLNGTIEVEPNGIDLRNTIFGWFAIGETSIGTDMPTNTHCFLTIEKQLRMFRKTEEPMPSKLYSLDEKACQDFFK